MKWIYPKSKNKDIKAALLEARKVLNEEQFFNPTFEHIHHPKLLYGAVEASEVILEAVKKKKKIFIHGDFDVDGVTATTIMWKFLYNDLGADATPFIPNRFDHGYGLSDDSIQEIIDKGGELIISVDCGIKDIEIVHKYKDKIDFVITDHHSLISEEETELADLSEVVNGKRISRFAKAIVHPQLSEEYPFHSICGAVVSWKVCWMLNEISEANIDMKKYIDLAALGTVCDVMPLTDENRAIVKLGIEQMKNTEHLGINSLLSLAGVDKNDLKSYHYGFVLGPRINAAGRIEDAMQALRLLSTTNKLKADEYAHNLNQLNNQRQELTKEYYDNSIDLITDTTLPIYFVVGNDWPEGILGLIAGKLAQKFNKPVLVGSHSEGRIKGSARSPEYLNITEIFKKHADLLDRFGGHAQAAGFQLPYSNFQDFHSQIIETAKDLIKDIDTEVFMNIDLEVSPSDLDSNSYNLISKFEPFGVENAEPIISFRGVKILNLKAIGSEGKHIKLTVSDGNSTFEVIGFNMAEKFSELDIKVNSIVDVAGYLDLNTWNGHTTLQMRLKDIRIVES